MLYLGELVPLTSIIEQKCDFCNGSGNGLGQWDGFVVVSVYILGSDKLKNLTI